MIINKTRDIRIADSYIKCDSFFSKLIGMMFKSKAEPLIFFNKHENKLNLHSFFCPEMDLIFLNWNYKIIEIKENWKPWGFYQSKNKVKYLLELPAGTISKSKTEVGDIIEFSVL
ncbi:MAG: DUF192 domain-containing protein [Candidatus Nanoarchaeia archaeon]|nr:DUF192 domain-containing protein [Candidatus Nanoarchaeia archaeon]